MPLAAGCRHGSADNEFALARRCPSRFHLTASADWHFDFSCPEFNDADAIVVSIGLGVLFCFAEPMTYQEGFAIS